MENLFDLIAYLNTWCQSNKVYFCAGPEHYNNIVVDNTIYENYDLILCVAFNMIPQYGEVGLTGVTYQGSIALGRKREVTDDEQTESSLDETFMQKYTRRLVDLAGKLNDILEGLQCEQDAYIDSCTMNYVLNKYDLNVDFVNATVNIRFEAN